jgi:hypothetical protein
METDFSHALDLLGDPDGPIPLRFLLTDIAIDSPASTISARISLNAALP